MLRRLFYCHVDRLSSFMKDFSFSVRIHESINIFHEIFTKVLNFVSAEKSGKLIHNKTVEIRQYLTDKRAFYI